MRLQTSRTDIQRRVLVIDDDPTQRSLLGDMIARFGGASRTPEGNNVATLLPKVRELLCDQSEPPFDATVLDIMFKGETFGGVALWKLLSDGERGRAGKLLIVTKGGHDGTCDFAMEWANGRMCFLGPWDHVRGFIHRHVFGEA